MLTWHKDGYFFLFLLFCQIMDALLSFNRVYYFPVKCLFCIVILFELSAWHLCCLSFWCHLTLGRNLTMMSLSEIKFVEFDMDKVTSDCVNPTTFRRKWSHHALPLMKIPQQKYATPTFLLPEGPGPSHFPWEVLCTKRYQKFVSQVMLVI